MLLGQVGLQAQKKRNKKERTNTDRYIDGIFGAGDKDFDVATAPEKWSGEPAVILCQKYFFYSHVPMGLGATGIPELQTTIRRKILIQDPSVVEDYSEYYYQTGGTAGITIIKPDGKEQKVDFSNAVEVKTEVPSRYRNSYRLGSYYKIAIPNLEVGDIIDYYVKYEDYADYYISHTGTITEEYPVVCQEYIYDVPRRWKISFASLNGAPDFKQMSEKGVNRKGKKSKSVVRYVLRDEDRPANIPIRWDAPILTEPSMKVLLSYEMNAMGGERNKDKRLDLMSTFNSFKAQHYGMFATKNQIINFAMSNFDRSPLKSKNTKEAVNGAYDMVKFATVIQSLDADDLGLFKKANIYPFSWGYYPIKDSYFAFTYAKLLDKAKVDYDYVMAMPSDLGLIDQDAINFSDFSIGIYVPATDTYYWYADNFSQPGEISKKMLGGTAYHIPKSVKKWKKETDAKLVDLPVSAPADHVVETEVAVTFADDNQLEINQIMSMTGVMKTSYSPLLLYDTPFSFDEYVNTASKFEKRRFEKTRGQTEAVDKSYKKKYREQKAREKAAEDQERSDTKLEYITEWIGDDYDLEEVIDFEILDAGRKTLESPLQVQVSFAVDGYYKKAGPSYILDLGRLAGSQLELSQDDLEERTKPVEMGFARTIRSKVTVPIPDGKSVEGLEALRVNIDNEVGKFVSTADIADGNIILTTEKVYKEEYVHLENWPKLVEMLEAAYKFSQQKVVLK